MTITDYDSVYALWLSTPGMGLNTTDDSREGVAQFLLRNPATCFVAEAEGEIIGVIMAGHDGRRGYIYHTAVRVDCRRQGVGKALVDAAVQALEKEGIHKVALVAFKRNETGNGFWESMGFILRDDLNYRNKNIHKLDRIDT
ncbi:MAG: GNAT family N-acetyltransferase [Clostridia bacterium]|nr:GNAT family N-acetyltransferase [Clostridia bacterium]